MRLKSTLQKILSATVTALQATLLFSAVTLPALAANQDFNQQINVNADKESIDLKNNKVIFSGNVSVLQGTLAIKANILEVRKTKEKGSEVFVATGSPATYSQTLEDGKPISAQAKSIRYEVATRTLVLTGSAQLKQSDSLVNGDTIRYNLDKQKLVAQGNGEEVQVTAIFNPQLKQSNDDDSKDDSTDPVKPGTNDQDKNTPPGSEQ